MSLRHSSGLPETVNVHPRMKDLTGMVFGEMVVLGFAGHNTPKTGRRRPQWLIRCSCGVEKTMLGTTLRNTNVKSCGHLLGVKPTPAGGAAVNLRLNQYKSSAAKYDREFSLSRDEFAALLLGDCTYCGISPSSVVRARGKFQKDFYYNGIDRVDNSLGYTVDNCVSCCSTCNLMKRTMSVDDFIKHIHKVAKFNNPLPNREQIG